ALRRRGAAPRPDAAPGLRQQPGGPPHPDRVPPAQRAGTARRRGAVGQPAADPGMGRPDRDRTGTREVRGTAVTPQTRLDRPGHLTDRIRPRLRVPLPPAVNTEIATEQLSPAHPAQPTVIPWLSSDADPAASGGGARQGASGECTT